MFSTSEFVLFSLLIMEQPVKRRALFFIGGYDPKTPDAYFGRMTKELRRFDELWETRTELLELDGSTDIASARIRSQCVAENWQTDCDFTFLALDSLVLADFNRPLPWRLAKYLYAFIGFLFSGAWRFFLTAWRFGLYFLYPFLAIVGFSVIGAVVALLMPSIFGPAKAVIGIMTFFVVLAVFGKRWSVNHLMDLWSFSFDFICSKRDDADQLLDRFAEKIVRQVKDGAYDEIILIGHSTGGMLILETAARCLQRDPDFSQRANKVIVLTLGSTAMKAGYISQAKKFRSNVQLLVDDGKMDWVEIQCLTDPINFYKTDPVVEMGLRRNKGRTFPLVRAVRMRQMLLPETYRRIKRNLFRVHYQYVFANTERYWYDFYQICYGPLFLINRAKHHIIGNPSDEESAIL
ncbi:lipase [Brucella sp. NBRC 12950]|uniref:lipase n=1 Tax=Brucella sp. NBRC 12950 TaxID=2994518 RepID=UPI0024A45508|nr:lipase [Brucella sp. NBRC 12950]GLU29292.1 hypothetical protein Brsp01_45250 [Brucella sp. NBRC 12950]